MMLWDPEKEGTRKRQRTDGYALPFQDSKAQFGKGF